MLSYQTVIFVYDDGWKGRNKKVGEIRKTKDGWQFWAQGKKKYGGGIFKTIDEVKNSLE